MAKNEEGAQPIQLQREAAPDGGPCHAQHAVRKPEANECDQAEREGEETGRVISPSMPRSRARF